MSEDQYVMEKYKEFDIEFRNRYDETMLNLESVFNAKNILFTL